MGNVEKAVEIMRSMEEVEVTAVTSTTVLSALYRDGKGEEARWLSEEMVVGKGCEVDVTAYNVRAMNLEGGRPEGVEEMVDEMVEGGLRLDAGSFNCLMGSYCRFGRMIEAEEVFKGVKGEKGVIRTQGVMGFWCFICVSIGELEKAYAVFKEGARNKKAPDFGVVKVLAWGLVKKRMGKLAKGLVEIVRSRVPAVS